MTNCPCHSGNQYKQCCQRFHKGALPTTALELMRSRFAAYALDLPDYIMATTHPANPHYSKDQTSWKSSISQFSKNTSFNGLDILDFQEQGDTATVTFRAHLSQGTQDVTFTEKSQFEKVRGKWLYRSGEIS